jgi:alkanesulfonate monooxygenase SsuD/methylene tetrahydromethanopterin reductase-like flavin-dependent oxidoreductase (luciferase family)
VTLAENIAALDLVSKGRFDFGVGVGSQYEEFETFGIPPAERFGRTWELIDIVERCLHGGEEQFSHDGRYFKFPNVRWIIPPVQKRIPIFWGGFGPQGVQRAAERDYHLLGFDFAGTYARTLRERGRRPEDYQIGFVNPVSIHPDREKAFAAIAEASLFTNNTYGLRRNLDGSWPPESKRVDMARVREGWETGKRIGFVSFIAGPVEEVIQKFLPVVRGEALGLITHLMIEARQPGMKTEDVERTLTLFAREVMPVLKAEAAKLGR